MAKLLRIAKCLEETGKTRTTWYDDIKGGLMTPPVKIGPQASAWPDNEVQAVNAARIAGKSRSEIQLLVSRLCQARCAAL